ncbi:MAG: hydantoinase/oxoprolinase family protein [Kiloniellales bacterium]
MPDGALAGWDLGGAHLKVARVGGGGQVERVLQLPCALWRGLGELDAALQQANQAIGPAARHAVTMTGELVDLFESRAEGVARLVEVMAACYGAQTVRFYGGKAGFLTPDAAAVRWAEVASANWLASAAFAAACLPEGLLLDVGSTTTDVVPFARGRVLAQGFTDDARLRCGELVYRGVTRTPVMAVAEAVPFRGALQPLMAEFFASMADVYRLTGELPEDADQHATADGRAKTPAASARRLARMLGLDADKVELAPWCALAADLARRQRRTIEDAAARVLSRGELGAMAPLVGAGVGRFLVPELAAALGRPCRDFADLIEGSAEAKEAAARSAPAAAVALLAANAW